MTGDEKRELKNRKQREYRLVNKDRHTKKYEKTVNGYLMRCYRNMQSRVTGVLKHKAHLYEGKELLDRQQFYTWSKSDKNFNSLYNDWVNKDYDTKLSPSIGRVDSSEGYVLSNMRWLTHSKNSSEGSLSRYTGVINE